MDLPAGRLDQLGREVLTAVEGVDDVGDPDPIPLPHEAQDLLPPLLAVGEVVVEPGSGLLDDVTVTGTDPGESQPPEPLEGLDVDRHVAPPSRVHDRVHPVEHRVPGEQHPLLLEEEAQMVRRVTRGVQHVEAPLAALDGVALPDHPVGDHVSVLVAVLAEGEHLGAGRLHEAGRAGPVVGVRVGEHHPPDPFPHRRADDGVDVRLDVRSRVDDRHLVDPDQVRVRARTGERAWVRRDNASDER